MLADQTATMPCEDVTSPSLESRASVRVRPCQSATLLSTGRTGRVPREPDEFGVGLLSHVSYPRGR